MRNIYKVRIKEQIQKENDKEYKKTNCSITIPTEYLADMGIDKTNRDVLIGYDQGTKMIFISSNK